LDAFVALLPAGVSGWQAALLIGASFFTSAITGAFGLGGGLAMLAPMGTLLPVAALIPIHGAVQLGSNAGRAWTLRDSIRMHVARPFVAGSLVGAVAGAFLVIQLPDAPLKLVLACFILLLTWMKFPWIARLSATGLSLASALLAVISMFVGATGPLVSPVLQKFMENDRKGLVATHAAVMVVQHGLKVVVFGLAGFAFGGWLALVAAMIASGYLGTIVGTRLLERIDEATFARWFRIGLTLIALDLLRRGILGFF